MPGGGGYVEASIWPIHNVLVAFEEVIRLLTTSRRYRTLLIHMIFLYVSSEKKKLNLGLMKNNTNFRRE